MRVPVKKPPSIDDFLNVVESDVNFWGIATRY
jgi:hypothetical protein